MPTVERTGIYRNAAGHAYFLRKDRIVGDEIAANYALDENVELSPARQAIADADNAAASLVVGVDVTSDEVTTTGDPAETDPAPVAPGGRRKRRKVETPEDAAPPIETPEDGASVETPEDDEDAE